MMTYAERPMVTVQSMSIVATGAKEAREWELASLRDESACWRGEPAYEFAPRIGPSRRPELAPTPATTRDVYSPHGAGGRGIGWYQQNGEVVGYISGRRSGYRVPAATIAGLARCVPQGPWAAGDVIAGYASSLQVRPLRSLVPAVVKH